MPTPRYDALVDKVRDWSNKPEVNTIPNSVIQDCLGYSADECYRTLRIPPLEATVTYTVESTDNVDIKAMITCTLLPHNAFLATLIHE